MRDQKVRRKDLTGQSFGRWLVLRYDHTDSHRSACWSVQCECGEVRVVQATHLRSGVSQSCGCLQREIASSLGTHGHCRNEGRSRTYASWSCMRERCSNPNNPRYSGYGGRGIKVCQRWESFDAFLSDMGVRPADTTLDRIDVDGDYEPSNCRWASRKVQDLNKRNTRLIEVNGETHSLAEWGELKQVPVTTILGRLSRGWSVADAINRSVVQ